jgi:hypothetical protein
MAKDSGSTGMGAAAFKLGPLPGVPREVQASFVLWLAAVAAGVVEMIIRVIDSLLMGLASGSGGEADATGVAIRVIVYTVAVYIMGLQAGGSLILCYRADPGRSSGGGHRRAGVYVPTSRQQFLLCPCSVANSTPNVRSLSDGSRDFGQTRKARSRSPMRRSVSQRCSVCRVLVGTQRQRRLADAV